MVPMPRGIERVPMDEMSRGLKRIFIVIDLLRLVGAIEHYSHHVKTDIPTIARVLFVGIGGRHNTLLLEIIHGLFRSASDQGCTRLDLHENDLLFVRRDDIHLQMSHMPVGLQNLQSLLLKQAPQPTLLRAFLSHYAEPYGDQFSKNISAAKLQKNPHICKFFYHLFAYLEKNVYLCPRNLNHIPMLQVGDKMPNFAAPDETGRMVTDQDLIGKKTVIYFYPKDSTPGCTAEACNIRDNYHAFLAQGYQVFGVSKDSQASHIRFKEKYDLPFPLLSDPTTEMLQAFGAWGEKRNYGKVTMGTLRKTFIFDENGILERIIEKVDTKNHTAQLLGLNLLQQALTTF